MPKKKQKAPAVTPIAGTVGPTITLEVGFNGGKDRLVIARQGDKEIYRDRLDPNKAASREKFVSKVASIIKADAAELGYLHGAMLEQADAADATVVEHADSDIGNGNGAGKDSQGTQIVALMSGLELFHTEDGNAYASAQINGHTETFALRSKQFQSWVRHAFYRQSKKAPNAQGMIDGINALEAQALFDGPEIPVAYRVGAADGSIYIDLGDASWDAIKVSAASIKIVASSPVRFTRTRNMRPLPRPVAGGTLDSLWQFVNVCVADRPLILAWLLQALNPKGPYPVLNAYGQQGSCKSSLTRYLRRLTDPHKTLLRAAPKNVEDLAIAALNNWVLAFDNLSYLSGDLSDALCRLATGGGFATRELFTNLDEVVVDCVRPVALNSIEEVATRADLLERSIVIEAPEIPADKRKSEEELEKAWAKEYPRIFGALLRSLSAGIKNLPTTELSSKPRMADFALWAKASESRWGQCAGEFVAAYTANQANVQRAPLDASLLTEPLYRLLWHSTATPKSWRGTPTALLKELDEVAGVTVTRKKNWPENPRTLSNCLRRLKTNLKSEGVIVEFHHSGKRYITLTATEQFKNPHWDKAVVVPGLPGEVCDCDFDDPVDPADDVAGDSHETKHDHKGTPEPAAESEELELQSQVACDEFSFDSLLEEAGIE